MYTSPPVIELVFPDAIVPGARLFIIKPPKLNAAYGAVNEDKLAFFCTYLVSPSLYVIRLLPKTCGLLKKAVGRLMYNP